MIQYKTHLISVLNKDLGTIGNYFPKWVASVKQAMAGVLKSLVAVNGTDLAYFGDCILNEVKQFEVEYEMPDDGGMGGARKVNAIPVQDLKKVINSMQAKCSGERIQVLIELANEFSKNE